MCKTPKQIENMWISICHEIGTYLVAGSVRFYVCCTGFYLLSVNFS